MMLNFLIEMVEFIRTRKKYWLIPLIVVLIILGMVIVGVSGTAVSPILYTIF